MLGGSGPHGLDRRVALEAKAERQHEIPKGLTAEAIVQADAAGLARSLEDSGHGRGTNLW